MAPQATGNIREYSVSELSGAVKTVIEDGFSFVRVRGELGRISRPGSGHIYLDLKDDAATLGGVIWKGVAARLAIAPEQGMEVIATGRLTTFPGQSKYQIVIDALEPAGAGALMALLEDRKKRLAAEGLFDPARKRKIPYLPDVIGVVTSPSGAVIRDILHRVRERFPRHVIVWPTAVQGRGAEQQIAAAINGFNALVAGGDPPRPDVIIVARGGGSLEDLWCFNEEIVARAAAQSAIPLISAVGHETDTTLIDYVADLRAPTPTAAAEMATPMRAELISEIANKDRRLAAAMLRALEQRRVRALSAARGLGRPEDRVGAASQRLDRASDRLAHGLSRRAALADRRLAGVASRLSPATLDRAARRGREVGAALADRLAGAASRILARKGDRLQSAGGLLRSLSYEGVLDRGFALVRRDDGGIARRAADLPAEGAAFIRFADGERRVELGKSAPARGPSARGRKQGDLFE